MALVTHFQDRYLIKASTRDRVKFPLIKANGAEPLQLDIVNDKALPEDFFAAETLIINITGKDIPAYQRLVAAINQSPIRHVLFISSSSVYQTVNGEVSEDEGIETPASPLFQIENLFRQQSAFDTTVIRFSGLIDKQRHPGRFFRNGKTVRQADAPVNLIHKADCIGLIDAVLSQQCWGETFNGCASTHPTKFDYYRFACDLLDRPYPEFSHDEPLAYKIVSNKKAIQQLGYQYVYPDLMAIDFDEN
jgi:nucleoside-diphosphate-sugar epimerase